VGIFKHSSASCRLLSLALLALVGVPPVHAEKIDRRLAAARTAFVTPVDDRHGDDQLIAQCLRDRLLHHAAAAMVVVPTKGESDVILKVKGRLPGDGTRFLLGGLASASANLDVALPDGTTLWSGSAKHRDDPFGDGFDEMVGKEGIACGLAHRLLDKLVEAQRQARER